MASWKNRGVPLVTEDGTVVRQSRAQETRVRVALNVTGSYVYLEPEEVEPLANVMDDLQDAIEDGEFPIIRKEE